MALTGIEEDRLIKLEDEAINYYLDKTDFNPSDWLDEEEAKEYTELVKKQYDEEEEDDSDLISY